MLRLQRVGDFGVRWLVRVRSRWVDTERIIIRTASGQSEARSRPTGKFLNGPRKYERCMCIADAQLERWCESLASCARTLCIVHVVLESNITCSIGI